LNRIECVEAFAEVRGEALVIVSPGFTGHELAAAQHRDETLYNMEMGYAAAMCLGLALARQDRQVVALEGDGSMLMALGTFATIARYAPRNLTIVVFDNQRYLTTGSGSVETATAQYVDLAAAARACGVANAVGVADIDAFQASITRAMSEDGPWVIVAKVDASDRSDPRARGGFPYDVVEQSVLFQRALRAPSDAAGR
jgi:thiamine pyrophosphate-dependent acetolactate synthase large subunit-like protein